MSLYHFHRVLIGSAILFFFGFGLYSFRQYTHGGEGVALAMGISSTVVCVGMVGYLIYFNRVVRLFDPTRVHEPH